MRTGIYEWYEFKMRDLSKKMQTWRASRDVLAIVEERNPVSLDISSKLNDLYNEYGRASDHHNSKENMAIVFPKLGEYLVNVKNFSGLFRCHLIGILIIQEYLDIIGRAIKSVIELVRDIEECMVNIIKMCGKNSAKLKNLGSGVKPSGIRVPGVDSQESDFSNQVDVNHLLVKSRF